MHDIEEQPMCRTEPVSVRDRVALVAEVFAARSMPALAEAPELARRAEHDLAERARPGALIYTAVWLVVSTWGGLWATHAWFALVNLGILLGLLMLRIGYHVVVGRRGATSNTSLLVLTMLILVGALHWGVLSAWVIASGRFDELHYPFMIMLPAFAMGGTAVLGISRLIRQAYPCLVFVPSLLGCALAGGRENLMLVVLAICSLAYVLIASRTSAQDYWSAIHHATVAGNRAELLEVVSTTDPLTGAKNRLCFNTRFESQWQWCAEATAPLGIVLVDLDHFKEINDSHGHLAGDECLRQVAGALATVVRDDVDTLARYGGEEFVAILPGVDLLDAGLVAERMVEAVRALRIPYGGELISVSCSCGAAAAVPRAEDDRDRLLAAADAALYVAKAGGRDRSEMASGVDGPAVPPRIRATTTPG